MVGLHGNLFYHSRRDIEADEGKRDPNCKPSGGNVYITGFRDFQWSCLPAQSPERVEA